MHRSLLSAVLPLSILLNTVIAAQDASYTFTTIDVPGASGTEAFGINRSGRIVGSFGDATGGHGFLKDGVTYTPFDAPGAVSTWAYGINEVGQIAGHFYDIQGGSTALKAVDPP